MGSEKCFRRAAAVLQQAARAGSGTQVAAQVEVLFRDGWL
jgi:hypothetical protein